jgi:hypothetical protein
MKRLAIVAALATGALFIGQPPTHASLEPAVGPTTTDENSVTPKTVFGFDETPFAFIQFESDKLNVDKPLKLRWTWKHEHDLVGQEYERTTDFPPGDTTQVWNALDIWDEVKEPGDWSVKTNWFNLGEGGGFEKTHFTVASESFTVTPEPLGISLFLLGGTALAAGLRRRKKVDHAF